MNRNSLSVLLVSMLALQGWSQSTTMTSKAEPPDVYDFGYSSTYTPRYEHDPADKKLILNPDFFCTQCAAEGRIKARRRDDMKGSLEFDKNYPSPLEGRAYDHFGSFRLLEQEAQTVIDYLFKNLETQDPVFIEDAFFRLFTDLEAFHTKTPIYPRREFELQQLADVFPEVSEKTVMINPHQRAHLYLFRAHRLLEEFQFMTGYTPKAPYMDYTPPFMGMRQKWEIYLFRDKKDCSVFSEVFIGQKIDDGLCWHLLKERGMVTLMHGEGRKDVDLNNTFCHRLSYSLIYGYRAYRYDLPAWLGLGFAHLMERRERTDFNTFIFGEGQTPRFRFGGKWKVQLKKDVLAKKVRPFAEFADQEHLNAISPEEHVQVWSLVSYLMQLDIKKFGEMVNVFKDRKEGESMRNLVIRSLRTAYGITINEADENWRQWVRDTYPSN